MLRDESGKRSARAAYATSPIRLFASGTEVASRYEIRGVLGHGGSAVVYDAWDRELKRPVALKVLRGDRMTEAGLRRFRHEVAVARDAASPFLVRVFDIGQAGETVFLTMELVEGESLRHRIEEAGALPVAEALRIGCEVLRALDVLHGLGIVHRDVKPGNILLDPGGSVKLADFGLARRWDGSETRATETDGVVGTAEYLSPEQALGKELDSRTDLYSFGVVLFEMLAGDVPLRRDSAIGTILAHVKEAPRDLRREKPGTPPWLSAVVARLLAKEPGERYASAREVLSDLEARHATASGRRRGRRVAASAALGAVLLAGAALVTLRPWVPRFARLAPVRSEGERAVGIAGVDGRGRVLWSREDVDLSVGATTFRQAGGGQGVAAVLGSVGRVAERSEPGRLFTLSFLDPGSGGVISSTPIADGRAAFPSFSPQYGVGGVHAVDLDGDGADEIAVTYLHSLYWPSFTVLYEPHTARSRVVLYASGHHRLACAADLDGDGRRELVFWGPNNRMGWYTGFAAVRVPLPPSAGEGEASPGGFSGASTPDTTYLPSSRDNLAWYTLGPRFTVSMAFPRVEWNPSLRVLAVTSPGRAPFLLTGEGFVSDGRAIVSPAARTAARAHAYEQLRTARRLADLEDHGGAVAAARKAGTLAEEASETYLAEWAHRVEGRALARAGRQAEAERVFEALFEDSDSRAEIAFDAADSLHLSGRLSAAAHWYEKGIRVASVSGDGHPPREFESGLVLALVEAGRSAEARKAVESFSRAFGGQAAEAAPILGYLRWRSRDLSGPCRTGIVRDLDLYRYWDLECRLAAGDPADEVAREASAELGRASDTRDLVRSVLGALALREGRVDEALAAARQAFEGVEAGRSRSTELRAHLDVVAERYARAAEAAGKPAEARKARAAVASLARERRVEEK